MDVFFFLVDMILVIREEDVDENEEEGDNDDDDFDDEFLGKAEYSDKYDTPIDNIDELMDFQEKLNNL